MQKYQQLAKDAQSNGDPVLSQNYLQHADHYLRRFNELNERDNNFEKNKISRRLFQKKRQKHRRLKAILYLNSFYLKLESLRSIFILSNSNFFSCFTFKTFPDGNFNFVNLLFSVHNYFIVQVRACRHTG